MKNKILSSLILVCGTLAIAATGCAHARVNSGTKHEVAHYTVALPPGWTVADEHIADSPTANALDPVAITAPGTNAGGFWASLVAPRPHVYRDFYEAWSDTSAGGGTFVFTDPAASQLEFDHTNQSALGGGRQTKAGSITSTITTNAVSAITAGGSAVGNVIGAATKAATTP